MIVSSNFSFSLYFHSIKEKVHSQISTIVKKALTWLSQAWQGIQATKIKLFGKKVSLRQTTPSRSIVTNHISSQLAQLPIQLTIQPIVTIPTPTDTQLLERSARSLNPNKDNKATTLPKDILAREIFAYQGGSLSLPRICQTWKAAHTSPKNLFNNYNNCSDWFLGPIIREASQILKENSSEKDYQVCLSQIQKTVVNLAKQWPGHEAILAWEGHPAHFKRIQKISEWIKENSADDFAVALSIYVEQARGLPFLLASIPQSKMQTLTDWIKAYQHPILELNLTHISLKVLPDCISEFKSLQRLNLSSNQLQFLPESIGQMAALQSLYLHNNQLKSLPESIGQMTALQHLILNNNQLQTLPESIGHMIALQTLNLYVNQLQSLPESIGQLTTLESFSFDDSLRASVVGLQNLKRFARF